MHGTVGVVESCCPDEGSSFSFSSKTDVLAGECPAYKIEAECLKSELDSTTDVAIKIMIRDRMKEICKIMKGGAGSRPDTWPEDACPSIPDLCKGL